MASKEIVYITGYKNVKINNVKDFVEKIKEKLPSNVWIQFFDSSVIANWQHIFFAIINAKLAFKNQCNISKSIDMETLLFASAQNQINKAINLIGIKPYTSNIAILIVAKEQEQINKILLTITKKFGIKPDESVIEFSDEKKDRIIKTFEITKNEIESVQIKNDLEEAIKNLIIERMAILSTKL
jgi:tRNA threonylcarbamoyladenosine modification (KEOPS) complex Cgi121 subunit